MTTETKHTPGNWKTKPLGDIAIVHENQGFLVTDDEDNRIAVIVKEDIIDSEMFEANARLIAHAPELLEALEALVDDEECRFDHHGYCQTHNLSNPCDMQRAREVITRAKGGAT